MNIEDINQDNMHEYFLYIPPNKVQAFTVQVKKWDSIKPIQIQSPEGFILPYDIINAEKYKGVFNPNRLEQLDILHINDITFIESEIQP